MKQFRKVFSPLVQRAADKGLRIAFENCDMGGDWRRGDWNIAHAPTAWEMIFNEVPAENLGLEWEPCHQMVSLIDPLPQLRKWAPKVFHLHGKDATIDWAELKTTGLRGGVIPTGPTSAASCVSTATKGALISRAGTTRCTGVIWR